MEGQMMFITPMEPWSLDKGTALKTGEEKDSQGLFRDMFGQAVQQVTDTQREVEEKQYLLATGQLDDMHTLPIAEAKAALSLDVLVTMRNKALDAYNELMRISL